MQASIVQENVVSEAVAAIEGGIETFAAAIGQRPAVVARLAEALGIDALVEDSSSLDDESEDGDRP